MIRIFLKIILILFTVILVTVLIIERSRYIKFEQIENFEFDKNSIKLEKDPIRLNSIERSVTGYIGEYEVNNDYKILYSRYREIKLIKYKLIRIEPFKICIFDKIKFLQAIFGREFYKDKIFFYQVDKDVQVNFDLRYSFFDLRVEH